MLFKRLAVTCMCLIFLSSAHAQETGSRKLYPVDDSHLDPSFAEFKARLLEAVERQDLDFLVSMAHPNIYLGNGVGSPESLRRNWKAKNYGGAAWQELRDALTLGAVRQSDSHFCAPYAPVKFPNIPHAIDYLAITASDALIRAEPKSTALIIDHLSYDIVQRVERGQRSVWETIKGERYRWRRIETPSGEIGYVWGKYVAGWLDTTVCFTKTHRQWLMWSWSGGD